MYIRIGWIWICPLNLTSMDIRRTPGYVLREEAESNKEVKERGKRATELARWGEKISGKRMGRNEMDKISQMEIGK